MTSNYPGGGSASFGGAAHKAEAEYSVSLPGQLRDLHLLAGFDVALAPEPVLHRRSQTINRHPMPGFQQPILDGRVSSKTASLVKFRIAKLSIQCSGHACRTPPASTRLIDNLRTNMQVA